MKNFTLAFFLCVLCFVGSVSSQPIFTPISLTNPEPSPSPSLVLYDEVTDGSANKLIKAIHEANKTGSGPLNLYINSPGGSVIAGMRILDAMAASKRPISTVCLSECASMAGIIFLDGEHRSMLRHSILLLHDGQLGVQGTNDKVASIIRMFAKVDAEFEQLIASRSGLSVAEVHARESEDWWMLASEAVALHLADEIVSPADYPVE